MKLMTFGIGALLAGYCGNAWAQTAEFGCPTSAMRLEYSTGLKVAWDGPSSSGACSGVFTATTGSDAGVVPAGTFEAFRIKRQHDAVGSNPFSNSGEYKDTQTDWYAPAQRMAVKIDFSSSAGHAVFAELTKIEK